MAYQAETAGFAGAEARASAFLPLFRQGLAAHGLLIGLVLCYAAALLAAGLAFPALLAEAPKVLAGILTVSVPAMLFGLAVFLFLHMAAVERPRRPLKALVFALRSLLASRTTLAAALPVVLALILFMTVFTLFKAAVGVVTPYGWDGALDRADVALHFGYRPWAVLQPLLGWPPVTFLINLNYNLWFVVMNVFWAYFAFLARPGAARTRFFLACLSLWMIAGTALALGFASAGPCYVSRLGIAPDPYAPLMEYLRAAHAHLPVWALGTQDMLWALKVQGSGFGGISAFPSMHNATALLFVLACPWSSARVRWLLVAHAALIFLGSIHLGWHYAVDAYAAWALALALWAAMGPVSRWWESTAAASRFRSALQEAR